MNTKYLIQWKSKLNGRAGRGTKVFELDEAQRLAQELNQEYPEIDHEVAESTGNLGERADQSAELNQEDQSRTQAEKPAGEPASIFSFEE